MEEFQTIELYVYDKTLLTLYQNHVETHKKKFALGGELFPIYLPKPIENGDTEFNTQICVKQFTKTNFELPIRLLNNSNRVITLNMNSSILEGKLHGIIFENIKTNNSEPIFFIKTFCPFFVKIHDMCSGKIYDAKPPHYLLV